MKHLLFILTIILSSLMLSCSNGDKTEDINNSPSLTFDISIPTAGNSWVMRDNAYVSSDIITAEGIRSWNNHNHSIRTFFYIEKPEKVAMGIRARVNSGVSKIKFSFGNESKNVKLKGSNFNDTYIGEFNVEKAGYYYVDIKGLEKDGSVYADINDILLGKISSGTTKYVKDDFYFGRRGPSVHLNFTLPDGVENVEWFYSELLIPENQDVIGSYFMANGFGEGYFGIQVNSSSERRILFSIWSPYKSDNPSEVPEEYKIKLLKKGEGVTTGKFGNEGVGGQSYKVFNWRTGVNYGFLIGAKPTDNGKTDYKAYFFDPEMGSWSLIAWFRRPKTSTYLTHLYSFLENFIPDQGVFERKGLYRNQWVYDSAGWHEINKVVFTADNTARKEYRLDYSGGVENDGFYLKNCGFTNDMVIINSEFERNNLNVKPVIDFDLLE